MTNQDPFTSDRYFVSQEKDGSLELKAICENTSRIADALDLANRIALMQTLPNGPKKDLLEGNIEAAVFKNLQSVHAQFGPSTDEVHRLARIVGGIVDEVQTFPLRGEGA